MKKRKKSLIGWVCKSHLTYFGQVFMDFKENPVISVKKNKVYNKKVRITVEEL